MAGEIKKSEQGEVRLGILRIRVIGFSMDERLFVADKEAKVEFRQSTGFSRENSIVFFTLITSFFYSDSPTIKILELKLESIFTIPELTQFIEDGNQLNLPANVFITIVSLSIGHSRALIASHAAGTAYQETMLPIIDPVPMTKAFFPKAFENIQITHAQIKPIKKRRHVKGK